MMLLIADSKVHSPSKKAEATHSGKVAQEAIHASKEGTLSWRLRSSVLCAWDDVMMSPP
jgi:hypothetical protein